MESTNTVAMGASQPIPRLALCIVILMLLIGFGFSIFIFSTVHNASFFVSFLLLSALILTFIFWNSLSCYRTRGGGALLVFLRSFPDSDLTLARHGQIVKITGPVSCGNLSLESSYERVTGCIYTSTHLYEYTGPGLMVLDFGSPCFLWKPTHFERYCTDFYISDRKSGTRALVKAGVGCKVIPLITESTIISSTSRNKVLSPDFRKWLRDRTLSDEWRLMRLEEGYIREGSLVTVVGMLSIENDVMMLIKPPESISTGCLWQRLLLPVDFDGLIISHPP
ncbi:hypothetical protein Dimus_025370 [Dionaea muscipula]